MVVCRYLHPLYVMTRDAVLAHEDHRLIEDRDETRVDHRKRVLFVSHWGGFCRASTGRVNRRASKTKLAFLGSIYSSDPQTGPGASGPLKMSSVASRYAPRLARIRAMNGVFAAT